jgi:glycerol-3-phosphate dehydrogenase
LQTLYARYGSRIEEIADFINQTSDAPLKFLPEYSKREIAFLVQHEKVIHLDDVILRRTMLAMLGRLSKQGIEELADVVGDSLSWKAEQKTAEVARMLRVLADRHGVQF